MKVVLRSLGETRSREVKTLPSHLVNFQWSREQKVEPGSGKHDPHCEICQRTKITNAPCRRRIGGVVLRAQNFGYLITADHTVLSEESESRNNHRYGVVVQDLATQWIQSYP